MFSDLTLVSHEQGVVALQAVGKVAQVANVLFFGKIWSLFWLKKAALKVALKLSKKAFW